MHFKNVIILVLAGLILFFFSASALQAEHQEEFQKILPLSSEGTFSLKNVNGSVTVTTWKEQQVEIKALKKTDKEAENLAKVKIEIESSPNLVSVDTVYPKNENTGVSVTYDVKVPEGINLEAVSSVNGKVNITGPFGRVSASTVNGDVGVVNASGDLRFSTTNGDIEAANIRGKIDSQTTNGSIHLIINTLGDGIKAKTVNGSITLKLSAAQEINANLDAQTVNGHFEVDFPVTFEGLQKSKHHLKGQMGKGGPSISLRTVNGSIRLIK